MGTRGAVTAARWLAACGVAMGLVLAAGAACGGEPGRLTLKDPPLAVLGGRVLAKQYAGASITPLPAAAKAGPTSYLVVPKEVKPGGAATSVATACLVLPDKTVVRLEAYANPEACKDLAGCTALAKEILSRAADLPRLSLRKVRRPDPPVSAGRTWPESVQPPSTG